MPRPELLVVGRIQRPHGLAGEVSVEIRTDFPERFGPGSRLIWRREEEAERTLNVTGARSHGKRMLLTLEGITDVEAARGIAGGDLCVAASEAFPAPADFFYSHEIRGFACEDRQGRRLGSAAEVEQTPGGPLLTVELPSGALALVPFVETIVLSIDRAARRIVLDPPEGLLDL